MAHPVSFNLPTEPKGIEYLIELALDLRGTWEHSADELWGQLDPELWRLIPSSVRRPRRWHAPGSNICRHRRGFGASMPMPR